MSMLLMMSFISMMIIFTFHPLMMGFILLVQTIMISLIMGKMYINFWYSYILFLILVGAMLILFIYMTSLASNEKIIFNKKLMFFLMLIMITSFLLNFTPFNSLNLNSEMINLTKNSFNINISKYLNFPSNLIYMFMIIYLLLTLIAVVKISNFKKGPLRQLN
uniref:NADH-ubiquinone oxidoreductase chain 6 n=1 Tax=Coleoptera sp. 17 KM-2017 TaxID=2219320 RepID=A0A346RH75_9COLE|nr:NADH dehydrogenase subunit 6 [Coleoptera sp. 17 KM-2017]